MGFTMESAESQQYTLLKDEFYDDPEKLSQLLRQRAGSDHHFQFTTSPEKKQPSAPTESAVGAGDSADSQAPPQVPVAAPARHLTSRRAPTDTRHVKPSLPKHQSAPATTGFVKEREGGGKMYQSFGDFAMGDTQPDSQMYKNWTSGVFGTESNGSNDATSLLNAVHEDDADTPTDGADVVGSSQEHHSQTITSPTVIQDDDPETQLRFNAPLTSPLKFETPAMAGRKRDNQGHVLSSAMRTATTPGTVLTATAFFPLGVGEGGIGHGMSLTQIFHATQAGTSPLVAPPSEDAVFQRPSPNFTRPSNSSPIPAVSSPIKAPRTDPRLRSSSEPRAEYVTMIQSQERRSREAEDEDSRPAAQDSWDDMKATEARIKKRMAREKWEREANQSFALVTAPSLSSPPRRLKKGRTVLSASVTPKFHKPAATRTLSRSAYDGPFDDSDDEMDELIQPTPLNGNQGDDDSLDELSQGIPSAHPTPVKRKVKDGDNVQVPNTSSHPQRTLSGKSRLSPPGSPSAHLHHGSQDQASDSPRLPRGSRSRVSKDLLTIMDSQPDAGVYSDSIPRPKSLLLPSSPSSNEYSINQTTLGGKTGFTSQVVSSSMPPMPPRSSSQALGGADEEERVPSSPPALNVDDIVYDEHDYEEHHAQEGDGGSEHGPSVHEDVEMQSNDGVPESEYVPNEEEEEVELGEDQNHDAPVGDLEIPGTLNDDLAEEDDLIRSSHPEGIQDSPVREPTVPHRSKRQSTIPESDMMEDTQPSLFAQTDASGSGNTHVAESAANSAAPSHTHSTATFHTAREDQPAPQSNKDSNESPKHGEVSTGVEVPHFRSLNDIANQPSTQTSNDVANIEIPQLIFSEDIDNAMMSGSSPTRPPAKKRKITYSARKKTVLRSTVDFGRSTNESPSSPLRQVEQAQADPPSSTMEREERGALAAANAREEAILSKASTLKAESSSKLTKSKPGKKGALRPINKDLLGKPPVKSKATRASKDVETVVTSTETDDADVAITVHPGEVDELAGPNPQAREATATIQKSSDRGETLRREVLFPNRVIAFWPGQGYYTATCLGRADSNHLQIRYDDDGTIHTLDPVQVRILDLRIGDQVKINQPGMKKHVHVIVGLKDKIDANHGDEFPQTDRFGYTTVVLEVKQRDSLPNAQLAEQRDAISVPVEKIYLTNQLWGKFRDRMCNFSDPSTPSASASRVVTPATDLDSPVTPTQYRRGTIGPSLLKETTRAGSMTSSVRGGHGTLFTNMVFAITLQDDSERDAIVTSITSNNGRLLDDNFRELFEGIDTSNAAWDSDQLAIRKKYKELRFVALITDSHSRRTKHIQALALNIPCLHYRWLTDSTAAATALPFSKYLLPAGLSTYFDPEGVVRSRVMDLYDPGSDKARFEKVFKGRNLLLQAQSALLVMGKTKKALVCTEPYLFLTLALGPKVVGRCADVAAAKDMIKDGDWDWVYVVGGADALDEADDILFGGSKKASTKKGPKSKKRKRGEIDDAEFELQVITGNVGAKSVRLACDEFIVQSLILGALIEQ